MRKQSFKKINYKKSAIIIGVFLCFTIFKISFAQESEQIFSTAVKKIIIDEEGLAFQVYSETETVEQFLRENEIELSKDDQVLPEKTEKIYSGSRIFIHRAKKITIKEGGKVKEVITFQNNVEKAIWENKDIELGADDITKPSRQAFIKDGSVINITHVLIKEEIEHEDIAFKTVSNEDDKMGWREKKVTQKGEKGKREVKYKVVYNDGKEISRKVLDKTTLKEPVEEIVTQGTYVKVGKVHTGAASWYAWTGTMAAANPWLPMGSYVRVTNKANGKQVIVKINDRGPFGPGRIIDLDKVAFAQIASIGAGVVDVKMEVIIN